MRVSICSIWPNIACTTFFRRRAIFVSQPTCSLWDVGSCKVLHDWQLCLCLCAKQHCNSDYLSISSFVTTTFDSHKSDLIACRNCLRYGVAHAHNVLIRRHGSANKNARVFCGCGVEEVRRRSDHFCPATQSIKNPLIKI